MCAKQIYYAFFNVPLITNFWESRFPMEMRREFDYLTYNFQNVKIKSEIFLVALTHHRPSTAKTNTFDILKQWRWAEFVFLCCTSLITCLGIFLVYQAKTTRPLYNPALTESENLASILTDDLDKVVFENYAALIEQKQLVNLYTVREPDDVVPALSSIENENERAFIAQTIVKILKTDAPIQSVKALSASPLAESLR